MAENFTCPQCGAPLLEGAPPGPCPDCLWDIGLPEKQIGSYRIFEQIGEGGYGVVYRAERQQPYRQTVAPKVVKAGMDTRQVLARFEAERQALALMNHPNIAKVLGGGVTEKGRPYFVMEYVKGLPITQFCDQQKLGIRERLTLLATVCRAVQHAHQKLIIHRDLTPSNVLVALGDDGCEPVPKIIDFGIAKALAGQRLTDRTHVTAVQAGAGIGTPGYMSPEQAEPGPLDLDTRTDIYSLGVLLYHLLAGSPPFDSQRLDDASSEEIRRIIREEEPPPPSKRLRSLSPEELKTVAARRATDPATLLNLVRGDLDWIAMRCLEKDRARRYETANGLARDLQRFLDNEPVVARPRSKIYLLQKMVRRNRLAFAAGGTVAVSLLIASVALTSSLHAAIDSRRQAVRAKEAADVQARRADSLRRSSDSAMQFLKEVLLSAETYNAGDQTLKLDYFFRAAQDRFSKPWEDKRAQAIALGALGRVACDWQRYELSTNWLAQAADLWQALTNSPDVEQRQEANTNLAAALNFLAWATLGRQDKKDGLAERARAAEPHAHQAFDVQRAATDPAGDSTLCLQGDWLALRLMAGDRGVLGNSLEYLAAARGQSKDQFTQALREAIAQTARLAGRGDADQAERRVSEFIEPFLDPSRPRLRRRVPLALASAGEQMKGWAPMLALWLNVDAKDIEACGPILIHVAHQTGTNVLPAQHLDLKKIELVAQKLAHQPGF